MAMPRLRFGDSKIDQRKVSDLFIKNSKRNKSGLIKNVITNSAEHGLISQSEFFDKEVAVDGNTDNYYVLESGDFVYNPRKSNTAPYGPFNRYSANVSGIVSPLYMCITPKNLENGEYLSWYFKSSAWHKYVYLNGSQGARYDRVSMTDSLLMNIPVAMPSLSEQKKIADFLSTVDEKLETEQKKLGDFQQIKKGFMQKIFSQEIRFKADDGSEYPEWDFCQIKDICIFVKKGINPYEFPDKYFYEYSMPAYDENKQPSYTLGKTMSSSRVVISEPVVLFNKLNVRKQRIWNIESVLPNSVCSSEFLPIKSNILQHKFLMYWLFTDRFTEYVKSISTGSSNSQKRISPDGFMEGDIAVPSLPEQQKIADFFTALDERIDNQRGIVEDWKQIKKGFLQQLFPSEN